MPTIRVNDNELHYVSAGMGPEVVMLHGFLGNLAVWHLQIVPILRRSFRLTTYDLRGHGYSSVSPTGYTAHDMAEDLKGLLDGLSLQRPILVGHSFGADICLYFSLRYPERVDRLVALEPGLAALVDQRKDPSWNGWNYWAVKLQEAGFEVPEDKRTDLEYLFQVSLETPGFYGPARGLPRNRDRLLNLVRNTTLISDYEQVGELTLDSIPQIRTPTLLVYGERSHFLGTYEFLKKSLPCVFPVLLPGGEHFGPLEQPRELAECMLQFFSLPIECGSTPSFLSASAD